MNIKKDLVSRFSNELVPITKYIQQHNKILELNSATDQFLQLQRLNYSLNTVIRGNPNLKNNYEFINLMMTVSRQAQAYTINPPTRFANAPRFNLEISGVVTTSKVVGASMEVSKELVLAKVALKSQANTEKFKFIESISSFTNTPFSVTTSEFVKKVLFPLGAGIGTACIFNTLIDASMLGVCSDQLTLAVSDPSFEVVRDATKTLATKAQNSLLELGAVSDVRTLVDVSQNLNMSTVEALKFHQFNNLGSSIIENKDNFYVGYESHIVKHEWRQTVAILIELSGNIDLIGTFDITKKIAPFSDPSLREHTVITLLKGDESKMHHLLDNNSLLASQLSSVRPYVDGLIKSHTLDGLDANAIETLNQISKIVDYADSATKIEQKLSLLCS